MIFRLNLVLISMCLLACGGNSKPKDYWDLKEPLVHAWDTADSARITESVIPASEFKDSDIQSALGFQSYLAFPDAPPEMKFKISTECREQLDEINESSPRKFKKTSSYERSQRIYFYDFLPDEVLADDIFSNSSFSYNCDYKIKAINKIKSEIIYNFSNIKINTTLKNEINLYSKENDGNQLRSIQVDPDHALTDFPSLYFDHSSDLTFEMGLNLQHYKLISPGYIKCIDHEKIDLTENGNVISLTDIERTLRAAAQANQITFFKKCRVVAPLDSVTNVSLGTQGSTENSNRRVVWSEYFNVIFERPELEIQIEHNPELRSSAYPFNRDMYLDNEVEAFQITFTNNSLSPLKMRLPSAQKLEAVLNPIVYFMQLPEFKIVSQSTWGGLRSYQLNEAFSSELRFNLDGERVSEFIIDKNSSQTIVVTLLKNFKCTLPRSIPSDSEHKNSERGFRIQAIPFGSPEDTIIIDYLNKNKLESFPETFSLNRLLESATTNIKTTRTINLNKGRFETNYLQITNNRTHAIDAIVFRSLNDLKAPELPNFGFGNTIGERQRIYYQSSEWDMRKEILDAKKSNNYPSQLRTYSKESSYCEGFQ